MLQKSNFANIYETCIVTLNKGQASIFIRGTQGALIWPIEVKNANSKQKIVPRGPDVAYSWTNGIFLMDCQSSNFDDDDDLLQPSQILLNGSQGENVFLYVVIVVEPKWGKSVNEEI